MHIYWEILEYLLVNISKCSIKLVGLLLSFYIFSFK